jgi:hypothetical protein
LLLLLLLLPLEKTMQLPLCNAHYIHFKPFI